MHALVTNILLTVAVVTTVVLTQNPLALCFFYFIQQAPPPTEVMLAQIRAQSGGYTADAVGSPMGFLDGSEHDDGGEG